MSILRYAPIPFAVALGLSGSCATAAGGPTAAAGDRPPVGPTRPERCETVRPGAPLQPRIDAAAEGTSLCLEPGRHAGPVRIDRRLSLWGPRDAVVESNGVGTTVIVTAAGARIAGITIDGSGARYDTEDAALKVDRADDVRIEGVRIVNAMFGILSHRTNGLVIRDTEVVGNPEIARGMRGDAIRLWETRGALVEDNVVRHSRDVVVWYSPGNEVIGNTVEHGRYGTHFMYSHDNEVADNVYRSNAVGIFVMYSRGIHVHGNLLLDADGPSGMGIGLKESGNLRVHDNRMIHNAMGIYIDTSPLTVGDEDAFTRNDVRLSGRAVVFHGRTSGNRFEANTFIANGQLLEVEGGGDALEATWEGNLYDDYVGYDLAGDGVGDVPHEVRSLSNELTASHPDLAYFRGTAALSVVEAMGKLVPLFQPKTLMRDEHPSMADPTEETRR